MYFNSKSDQGLSTYSLMTRICLLRDCINLPEDKTVSNKKLRSLVGRLKADTGDFGLCEWPSISRGKGLFASKIQRPVTDEIQEITGR